MNYVQSQYSWVFPLIAVNKNDDIQLVIYMCKTDTTKKCNYYLLRTLNEALWKYDGCMIFIKIDLKYGSHQIELDKVFHPTHIYSLSLQAISAKVSPTIKEYCIDQLFKHLPRVGKISDTILVDCIDKYNQDWNLV